MSTCVLPRVYILLLTGGLQAISVPAKTSVITSAAQFTQHPGKLAGTIDPQSTPHHGTGRAAGRAVGVSADPDVHGGKSR